MDIQVALQTFVNLCNQLCVDKQSKELKNQRKECENIIIETIQERNMTYLEHGGTYFVLKKTNTKAPANADFFTMAYFEFAKDPSRLAGDIGTVAALFGPFAVAYQKHLGKESVKLKTTKKRPIEALLAEFDIQMKK